MRMYKKLVWIFFVCIEYYRIIVIIFWRCQLKTIIIIFWRCQLKATKLIQPEMGLSSLPFESANWRWGCYSNQYEEYREFLISLENFFWIVSLYDRAVRYPLFPLLSSNLIICLLIPQIILNCSLSLLVRHGLTSNNNIF